jgi:hypothetical protein
MVKDHRLVIVLLALAAIVAPAPAQGAFGPEARFDIVTPAGETPGFRDFAVDAGGFTYVLWPGLVQKYGASGALVKTWGGYGSAPGQFSPPVLYRSTTGIAVDGLGHVYVADGPGDRIVKFTTDGDFLANLDGLDDPGDVAVDGSDNVLVSSRGGLRKLAPDGTLLGSWSDGLFGITPGPGDRVYLHGSAGIGGTVSWLEGSESGQFPLLFGDFPDGKGNHTPSCCGLGFVGGRLWIARSMIKTLEAYGPGGGLLAACPAPGPVHNLVAGRDGRLYVSLGTSVVRYGDAAEPCDTERPRVGAVRLSQRLLHTSSYKRLRKAWLYFGASEQSQATLTLTRLVDGRRVKGRCVRATPRNRGRRACIRRRVKEASFGQIPVPVTDGGVVRFGDLLWRKRLPLGRYELAIVVVDRNGMRSDPRVTRLRLTR